MTDDEHAALRNELNRLLRAAAACSEAVEWAHRAEGPRAQAGAAIRLEDARLDLLREARALAPLLSVADPRADAGPGGVREWPQAESLRRAVADAESELEEASLRLRRQQAAAAADRWAKAGGPDDPAFWELLSDQGAARAAVTTSALSLVKAMNAHLERDRMEIYREGARQAGVDLTITEVIVGPDGTSTAWDITDADEDE